MLSDEEAHASIVASLTRLLRETGADAATIAALRSIRFAEDIQILVASARALYDAAGAFTRSPTAHHEDKFVRAVRAFGERSRATGDAVARLRLEAFKSGTTQ